MIDLSVQGLKLSYPSFSLGIALATPVHAFALRGFSVIVSFDQDLTEGSNWVDGTRYTGRCRSIHNTSIDRLGVEDG